MKKLLLCIICIAAVAGNAMAQKQNESRWSIRGGLVVSNLTESEKDGGYMMEMFRATRSSSPSVVYGSRVIFNIGVTYSTPLMQTSPLYIEPGVYFTGRGADLDGMKAKMYYIQIPVVLSWHFDLCKKMSLQPFFGPYYALGVSGKYDDGADDGLGVSDVFGKDGDLSRSDLGLRLGLGFDISHFRVEAGYDVGLLNIFNGDYSTSDKMRNGAFFLNVGYNF